MTEIRRVTVLLANSLSMYSSHNSAVVSLPAEPDGVYLPPDRSYSLPPPIRGNRQWDRDPVLRHADRAVGRGLWK